MQVNASMRLHIVLQYISLDHAYMLMYISYAEVPGRRVFLMNTIKVIDTSS